MMPKASMPKLTAVALFLTILALAAGACGGPDVTGRWEGQVTPPEDTGDDGFTFEVDLEVGENDTLEGQGNVIDDDNNYPVSVTGGNVSDEGAVTFLVGPGDGTTAYRFDGRLEGGDRMVGDVTVTGAPAEARFAAERQ